MDPPNVYLFNGYYSIQDLGSFQCKDTFILLQDSHYSDKMMSQPSYFCDGNTHTWKADVYIKTGLRVSSIYAE